MNLRVTSITRKPSETKANDTVLPAPQWPRVPPNTYTAWWSTAPTHTTWTNPCLHGLVVTLWTVHFHHEWRIIHSLNGVSSVTHRRFRAMVRRLTMMRTYFWGPSGPIQVQRGQLGWFIPNGTMWSYLLTSAQSPAPLSQPCIDLLWPLSRSGHVLYRTGWRRLRENWGMELRTWVVGWMKY